MAVSRLYTCMMRAMRTAFFTVCVMGVVGAVVEVESDIVCVCVCVCVCVFVFVQDAREERMLISPQLEDQRKQWEKAMGESNGRKQWEKARNHLLTESVAGGL